MESQPVRRICHSGCVLDQALQMIGKVSQNASKSIRLLAARQAQAGAKTYAALVRDSWQAQAGAKADAAIIGNRRQVRLGEFSVHFKGNASNDTIGTGKIQHGDLNRN
jgi:hypothetical protein